VGTGAAIACRGWNKLSSDVEDRAIAVADSGFLRVGSSIEVRWHSLVRARV